MDALSSILEAVNFKSSVYFKKDFKSGWGMEVPNVKIALFHLVVRGTCYMQTGENADPILLRSGDLVVLPHGDYHWLADKKDNNLVNGFEVVKSHFDGREIFNGNEVTTTLVCGHFEFTDYLSHPFIKSLPSLIHISENDFDNSGWLETLSRLIIAETESKKPGSEIVSLKLAETLFIQIIRAYLAKNVSQNFLGALSNEQISTALNLFHNDPQNNWTLDSISQKVGMSRASFANKFRELVGITPMNYLTSWRMNKAKELLKNKSLSMIDVTEKVGYSSEASFTRAFKKEFNYNPGYIRRLSAQ